MCKSCYDKNRVEGPKHVHIVVAQPAAMAPIAPTCICARSARPLGKKKQCVDPGCRNRTSSNGWCRVCLKVSGRVDPILLAQAELTLFRLKEARNDETRFDSLRLSGDRLDI